MTTTSIPAECSACKGTGLYVGMAEREGTAVLCATCKGSGRCDVTYTPWSGVRRPREGVRRVFASNCGVVLGHVVPGGISHDEWERGGDPRRSGAEPRPYVCPGQWAQNALHERPPFPECSKGIGLAWSACPHYPAKSECWRRFDAQRNSQP